MQCETTQSTRQLHSIIFIPVKKPFSIKNLICFILRWGRRRGYHWAQSNQFLLHGTLALSPIKVHQNARSLFTPEFKLQFCILMHYFRKKEGLFYIIQGVKSLFRKRIFQNVNYINKITQIIGNQKEIPFGNLHIRNGLFKNKTQCISMFYQQTTSFRLVRNCRDLCPVRLTRNIPF